MTTLRVTDVPGEHGAVRHVVLVGAQQRNAQSPSLWRALAEAASGIPDEVRVVVLSGEGSDFSAGLNRALFSPAGMPGEDNMLAVAATDVEAAAELIEQYQRGFAGWRDLPQIVVAAVQGNAIGAGFQLALAADLVVAAQDARFSMKEVTLGLVPDLAGLAPLTAAVGYQRALEICATGRVIDGREAFALGLAALAVPADELVGTVADLVDALLATAPAALRAVKPLVRSSLELTFPDQLRAERFAQASLLRALARGNA